MDKRCYSQSRERTEDERSFDDEHERAVRYITAHAASERRTGPLRYRHPGPHLVTHTKEILTMMCQEVRRRLRWRLPTPAGTARARRNRRLLGF